MIEISIYAFGHEWDKLNHVTQKDNKGLYDLMICKNCGIKGKRYRLDTIHVYERYINKLRCPVEHKQIKITHLRAFGKQFKNLTDGSIHDIVSPPVGKNRDRGEWVMGVGEPVLVLFGEFVYVEKGGKQ